MTQIIVRVSVGIRLVGDMNVMAIAECGSIAVVSIYGIFGSFDVKLERFQSIFVFKGEYEAEGRVCVGTAGI